MKISLICMGKTSAKYLREGENIYLKRLKHYTNVEYIELNEPKGGSRSTPEIVKLKEADVFMKYLEQGKTNILLDENGERFTSTNFSGYLEKHMNYSGNDINFYVGGAFGFDEKVYAKAHKKISLSSMTFSHQMVRLIFFEQLYRAFTIIKGEPYHND